MFRFPIFALLLALGPANAEPQGGTGEDRIAPTLPTALRHAVLIISKTNGYRHAEHIPHSNAVLAQLADELGRDSFVTENAAIFNDAQLRNFSVVILNSTTGDFLTADQQEALARFVANGGGVVALHAAGDNSHAATWYVDTIIGTRFIGHPGGSDQFQSARIVVGRPDHPVMAGVRQPWSLRDEWYSFSSSPEKHGMTVLARIDEASYRPGETLAMGADHPVVWVNMNAGGRVVYSALGHLPQVYDDPNYRQFLRNAILWAAGDTADQSPRLQGRQSDRPNRPSARQSRSMMEP